MSWTICNLFLPKNLIVTPEKTTTKSHDYGHTTTHDAKHTPTAMSLKGHCETCGAVKSSDGSACKKCACKQVYYCSKECQRTDWDNHKARCKARATAHNAGEAIPGLPQDVVVTHILRSDTDPIVIARLRAVSRPMRDAVDQTRLFVEEMPTERAAELGCLDTLHHQLLKGRLNKSIVCEFAAQGGQLEMLQWGHANGCLWDEKTCMNAAQGGHLEVIQWARANGCPWDEHTMLVSVAHGGHLEVLKWLRQNGCQWDAEACAATAIDGHLEVLKWLRENGCPWNERTCVCAAQGGNLEVLQWAHANGCPWDEHTMLVSVAHGGHLEVLKWLRANGCQWDADVCAAAAEKGHLAVLRWARANGYPWDVRGRSVERTPRGAAVGARERVPVGQGDVQACGDGRAS